MKKISRAIAALLVAVVHPGFAATPFENGLAPVELFTEFYGGGSVYRSLPDGFPVAPLLAGMPVTIIGSIERPGSSAQQLLLRSPLSVEQLRTRLLTAYAADGWSEIPYDNEFVLCSDAQGQLYMRLTSEANGSKLAVTRTISGPLNRTTCAQQRQIREAQILRGPAVYPLQALRPQFELPAGAVPGTPAIGMISTSSGSTTPLGTRYEMTVDGIFTLPNYSMPDFFQHFARQLQQQGWQVDSDDVGTISSSSIWFRTSSHTDLDGTVYELRVTAFLKLLKTSNDSYSYVLDGETFVPLPPLPIIVRPL